MADIVGTMTERLLVDAGIIAGWNSFFDAKPFRREMVNAADYAVFPRFDYREESLGDIAGRTIAPLSALTLLTLTLGWLGLRVYRRFPLVG
jgi:hypothetical protein